LKENWGLNGDVARKKPRKKSNSLLKRLSKSATEEERVNTIIKHGFSLSTLFHTLGPNTLSCDEIFVALEYKALLTSWEKKKKMWKALKEAFDLQEKAKAIITLGKPDSSLLAKELEELVKWKVGKDATKGKKKDALLQLWREQKDLPKPDILLSPEPSKPLIPGIHATELGRNVRNKVEAALKCGNNLQDGDLLELTRQLNVACQQRGIEIQNSIPPVLNTYSSSDI
jgi:hypothetical protein